MSRCKPRGHDFQGKTSRKRLETPWKCVELTPCPLGPVGPPRPCADASAGSHAAHRSHWSHPGSAAGCGLEIEHCRPCRGHLESSSSARRACSAAFGASLASATSARAPRRTTSKCCLKGVSIGDLGVRALGDEGSRAPRCSGLMLYEPKRVPRRGLRSLRDG